MVSTHKIPGSAAGGFAAYLTASAQRGDYYVGGELEGDGGAWHGSLEALDELGLDPARAVRRSELMALMDGRSPRTGDVIRSVGAGGSRVAGIDVTFSAPKSVSALWAVSDPYRRAQIEVAHRKAVASALARVEREVELVRRRRDGELRWERARSLVAAEFVHTSSRLTRDQERDGVPDPQLHSHLLILAAERLDRSFSAVDSRELFRSARVNGAWYRAQLAHELGELGVRVRGRTGRDGKYFEVAGVPDGLLSRWSRRSDAIERAAKQFRERYGRDPKRGELGALTVATRGTKTVAAEVDVAGAWRAVGEEHGLNRERAQALFTDRVVHEQRDVPADLLADLTRQRSMVEARVLEARALELVAGVERPERAQEHLAELTRRGELIELEGGVFTTRELRELEQRTLETAAGRTDEHAATVSHPARDRAVERVQERLAAGLSMEQRDALDVLTGSGGVVVLVGEAGTGKGVVLDAARDAWEQDGYRVIGAAVAGVAAQRLGTDSGMGETMTADALTHRVENARLALDERTVVVFDEAGMADTRRLATIVELTHAAHAKLVLAGDSAQLSPIGAGGLFGEIQDRVPAATLTEVYRANHAWERDAWASVRAGDAQTALHAYHEHGRLHLADTREQAGERMVNDWAGVRDAHPGERVVMITDASNFELDRLNQRAQQHRADRGELGEQRVALPDRPYGLARGDQVLFGAQQRVQGEQRVENGTRGQVIDVNQHTSWVRIRTEEPTSREVDVNKHELAALRLSYAQHVYKAQGMTADRALVLTGGWQTDRERAYVGLTRAREQTDIYTSREDLGREGMDRDAIGRLAGRIRESNAQQPSITREAVDPDHAHERQTIGVPERPGDATIEARDSTAERQPTRESGQQPVRISHRYNQQPRPARGPTASPRERPTTPGLERLYGSPRERDERPTDHDRVPTRAQHGEERARISQRYNQPRGGQLARDRDRGPGAERDAPLERERDFEREAPERGPYGQRLHDLIVSQQIEEALDHDRGEGIEI
jgi:conjugative relaxase-like TrwC/TraI family protein